MAGATPFVVVVNPTKLPAWNVKELVALLKAKPDACNYAGPAKLPPAQVKRFHSAIVAAFAAPEVREAMAKQGNVINPNTPEAAAAFFGSEQERYARLVKKAGISLD
jgi:tripartite-type tricarboxylate transporter receptor subunit TctC